MMGQSNNADYIHISVEPSGFFKGVNSAVTIGSLILTLAFAIWLLNFPVSAQSSIEAMKDGLLTYFRRWFAFLMSGAILFSIGMALWPATGRVRLSPNGEGPEYSTFSWLSMMFCAGIGSGILSYSVSEPITHFISNPEVLNGSADPTSQSSARLAVKYVFLHWGVTGWAGYALTGVALAYACHIRGLPLTIRSGVQPVFGNLMNGSAGHAIDILSVVAIIAGISVTIGLGANQLAGGVQTVFLNSGLDNSAEAPGAMLQVAALVVGPALAILTLRSGLRRGIKWLSNGSVILSMMLMGVFFVAGSGQFILLSLVDGATTYVKELPRLMTTLYQNDGTEVGRKMADWQGEWTIFYWAWWIAFAPFVGVFLARVSRGRTVREFVFGVMLAPTANCLVWFAVFGGTAIDLELRGIADGAIVGADHSARLFTTISLLLSPVWAIIVSSASIVLVLMLFISSFSAAVLGIIAITAGGRDASQNGIYIVIWSVGLTLIAGGFMASGGLAAIKGALIIAALPFSVVITVMAVAILKAIVIDRPLNSAPSKRGHLIH